jgi:hypothetical protein
LRELGDWRLRREWLGRLRLSLLISERRRSGALPWRNRTCGECDDRGRPGRVLCRDHPKCRKTQCHQSRNDSHYDAHRALR